MDDTHLRLPLVADARAPARLGVIAQALGIDLAVVRVYGNAPSVFDQLMGLIGAILGPTELDPLTRELAIVRTGILSGAEYEWGHHARMGLPIAGGTEAQVAALTRGDLAADAFDERQRVALWFTDEVVLEGCPSDEALAAILAQRSPAEVVELLVVIGIYMLSSRVARTAGVTFADDRPPPGTSATT